MPSEDFCTQTLGNFGSVVGAMVVDNDNFFIETATSIHSRMWFASFLATINTLTFFIIKVSQSILVSQGGKKAQTYVRAWELVGPVGFEPTTKGL